jgi:hypothetical protein
MNRVVLIYQMIPENIQIYLLEVNDADLAMLKRCHGVLCNSTATEDDHPVNTLSEWLVPYKDKIIYDDSDDQKYPVQDSPLNAILIVTGFML